jgi:hypothetical protein
VRPDGTLHPVRAQDVPIASNFDDLVGRNQDLRVRVELAMPTITETVRSAVLPFILPGSLPLREQYLRLDRWAPLIERPVYRFCARAVGELDSWRGTALTGANHLALGGEAVLSRYYALVHTVAHLTLLCSGQGAIPWLSDMAKSFTWKTWTPTFTLVREAPSGSSPRQPDRLSRSR